jgi:hypothetical protein
MFIRSLADFNRAPWAVEMTVGAITVTAQALSGVFPLNESSQF